MNAAFLLRLFKQDIVSEECVEYAYQHLRGVYTEFEVY